MRLKSPTPMQISGMPRSFLNFEYRCRTLTRALVIGWALHRHYSLMMPAEVVANSPSPLDTIRRTANLEG
jgi:hypothetical protein